MASSPPPPPPVDATQDAAPATDAQAEPSKVSELKAGSGRKREREGSMEPSDKMSALKLAALGVKKVKEDENAVSSSSSSRLSKSPPPATAAAALPAADTSAAASSTAPTPAPLPTASTSGGSSSSAFGAASQPKPKTQPTFSSFSSTSAFSAFANAKPFASAAATGSSSTTGAGGSSGGFSSFGDILSKGGRGTEDDALGKEEDKEAKSTAENGEAEDEGDDTADGVVKLAAQDTITGEEDEDTRHQVRCKLYVLEKGGSWKERGTGVFKINVHLDSGKPRLLMRADGVLRLILNVALFPGMSCERQDKWVRFSAFEDAQLAHLAVRAGSVKHAEELFDKIQALIPLDGSRPASALKPSEPADRAAAPEPSKLKHSTSTEVTFKEDADDAIAVKAAEDAAESAV